MVKCLRRMQHTRRLSVLGQLIDQVDLFSKVVEFLSHTLHRGEYYKLVLLLLISKKCQSVVTDFIERHSELAAFCALKLYQVKLYFAHSPMNPSTVEIQIGNRDKTGYLYYSEYTSTYIREIGIPVWLPRTKPTDDEIGEISNAIVVANNDNSFGQDLAQEVTEFMADMCKLSEGKITIIKISIN